MSLEDVFHEKAARKAREAEASRRSIEAARAAKQAEIDRLVQCRRETRDALFLALESSSDSSLARPKDTSPTVFGGTIPLLRIQCRGYVCVTFEGRFGVCNRDHCRLAECGFKKRSWQSCATGYACPFEGGPPPIIITITADGATKSALSQLSIRGRLLPHDYHLSIHETLNERYSHWLTPCDAPRSSAHVEDKST